MYTMKFGIRRGDPEGRAAAQTLITALLVATSGSGLLATNAVAADSAAAPVALEEVVVTARKQEESLQEIPITVTALTSKSIEQLGIKSIFDLATVTPGVYFGTTGGRNGGNKLQIRNFSTGTAGPSKASVFIDGVYSFADYASIPLANLERIEVLKGPQSAYFGRATFVGAVNFITRDPGNEFTGKIDLVGATEGEHDATGYVAFPIINDKLSQQFTFRHYSFEGPDEWRTTDGYHLGNQSTKAISSKTVFTPTEDIKLKFNYTYVYDDDHIPPVLYQDPRLRTAIARPNGTFGYYYNGPTIYDFSSPAWGGSTTQLNNPGIRHSLYRMSLGYEFKVLGQTVSGYVARNREYFKEQLDGNLYLSGTSPLTLPNAQGAPVTGAFVGSYFNYDLRDNDDQAEFRISSPNDWRLRYTVGYNYSNIMGHAQLFTLANVAIVNSSGAGGSFLNPAKDSSVFGGLYYDVTDKITVSGEGRYQNERILAQTYSFATANYGAILTDVTEKFTAFLPRFNAQYKFSPGTQLYLTYSEGNNPGGFQPITPAQALLIGVPYAFDEEKIKNYEIGLKTSWFQNRLTVNAAIFHMDFDKEQLAQTFPVPTTPTGFGSIYQTGVASKVDGFEIEANAIATEYLQVRATVGYGKAKYKSFCSVPYGALTGVYDSATAVCRSVAGFQHEGTPALQTSLSADYTHPLSMAMLGSNWSFYARGDFQYQSKVYNEEWNQSWIPGHGLANARLGLQNDSWTFEAFVRNATDDSNTTRSTRVTDGRVGAGITGSYPARILPAPLPSFAQGIAGQQNVAGTAKKPRQYGLRLAYQF